MLLLMCTFSVSTARVTLQISNVEAGVAGLDVPRKLLILVVCSCSRGLNTHLLPSVCRCVCVCMFMQTQQNQTDMRQRSLSCWPIGPRLEPVSTAEWPAHTNRRAAGGSVSHTGSEFLTILLECNIRFDLFSHLHSFMHSSNYFFS